MKKKGKEKLKSGEKLKPKKEEPNQEEEQKKPLDFGGLPSRDLKKNLGCG